MSQTNMILSYLKRGNSLTPLSALNLFKTMRLAARIKEIKECGVRIETTRLKLSTGKSVAQYRLKA
jgi:hypothetical protein